MVIPELGVLTQVDVRQAWAHEAHSFTPWLAQHLDALSAVIRIPLELEGQEVSVKPFFADILARNPLDDSRVLIENQLEGADHSHLGQILTYLSGLEAKTIVWVASHFGEAHLSAVRWLNDHTTEEFAFFAVKVKAVRIGDSPLAPVFEVLEKPSDWDETIRKIAEPAALSSLGILRKEFWEAYLARFPDEQAWGPATAASNRWHAVKDVDLVISLHISSTKVGAFIRGPFRKPNEFVYEQLLPYAETLAATLQGQLGAPNDGYHFWAWMEGTTSNRTTWPGLMEWLHTKATEYETALRRIMLAPVGQTTVMNHASFED